MRIFKLTNLIGSRKDPRKKRRTKLTQRPVRIGRIKMGAQKTILLTEDMYKLYKTVIDIYLDEGVLEITANQTVFKELREETDRQAAEYAKQLAAQVTIKKETKEPSLPTANQNLEVIENVTPVEPATITEEAGSKKPKEVKKKKRKRTKKKSAAVAIEE